MPTSPVEVPEEAVEALARERYESEEGRWRHATEDEKDDQRSVARHFLAAALPAIEDSCRKRWEEETAPLIAALERIADPIARSPSRMHPDTTTDAEIATTALQATREGGSNGE